MKKIGLYSILALMVLALLGCTCGRSAYTGPENPNFTVVVDDAETVSVLTYFQANTGYLPNCVLLDDASLEAKAAELAEAGSASERSDVLKSLAEGATCLVLKDAALIAEYDALGYKVDNASLKNLSALYHSDNAEVLGLSIVQMPSGVAINNNALGALAGWMTGAEAVYLSSHRDLLQ
ncbi:MAG: hypothetical protein IJK01_07915 [Clostridia bacterium]|jgi:hypothetical protein|nr:hypothetical protein [Clostridia bacterium]